MCTLIIGQNVLAPNTVILAGNRDENPARPSRGPDVLRAEPRLAGGADTVAGGTWMAIRERGAAVAMLNRWSGEAPAPPAKGLRSRGQLTLDLAAAGAVGAPAESAELPAPGRAIGAASLSASARAVADASLTTAAYAPFSAVFASPSGSWVLAHRGNGAPHEITPIAPGWHVLTHRELDDSDEPRAAHLMRVLGDWRPGNVDAARARLIELLASHDPPRACIHEGRMVTVSSFVVWLAAAEARYHHLDGRPCEHAPLDFSHLLAGPYDHGESE
jgi:hypothetical protein